jgi:hypothetical protein
MVYVYIQKPKTNQYQILLWTNNELITKYNYFLMHLGVCNYLLERKLRVSLEELLLHRNMGFISSHIVLNSSHIHDTCPMSNSTLFMSPLLPIIIIYWSLKNRIQDVSSMSCILNHFNYFHFHVRGEEREKII